MTINFLSRIGSESESESPRNNAALGIELNSGTVNSASHALNEASSQRFRNTHGSSYILSTRISHQKGWQGLRSLGFGVHGQPDHAHPDIAGQVTSHRKYQPPLSGVDVLLSMPEQGCDDLFTL